MKMQLCVLFFDRLRSVQNLPEGYRPSLPCIYQSDLEFEDSRQQVELVFDKAVPCSSAILWCDIPDRPLEVTVNGYKQGVTKKSLYKPSSSMSSNATRRVQMQQEEKGFYY
ncbi:tRNA-specific adenosine deaminase 1-like isoform X2 [Tachypleus tridentatus]|uniref:tRNA-specific adenosine deaminase 1-like isoform X2 n=1 Tax=Tachypleus tridentatus TaxID=6853 RepID=UPI003FD569F4